MKKAKGEGRKTIDSSLIFFLMLAGVICIESYKLGLGTLHAPLPGLFPFLIGILIGGLSIIKFSLDLYPSGALDWLKITIPWKRVLPVVAGLFIYALLLDVLGFSSSTFLLILFLIKGIEAKPWWVAGSAALAISVFMYLVFRVWLQVQLPTGFLGW